MFTIKGQEIYVLPCNVIFSSFFLLCFVNIICWACVFFYSHWPACIVFEPCKITVLLIFSKSGECVKIVLFPLLS
jgi:hypothetical protein